MQKKESIFPVVYGVISAIISFIAAMFICLRSFRLNLQVSIIVAGIFAIFFSACLILEDMHQSKLSELFINIS